MYRRMSHFSHVELVLFVDCRHTLKWKVLVNRMIWLAISSKGIIAKLLQFFSVRKIVALIGIRPFSAVCPDSREKDYARTGLPDSRLVSRKNSL